MERRKFLINSSLLVGISSIMELGNLSAEGATWELLKSANDDNEVLKLRPHHILDIITSYGNNENFEPHPYGHSYHMVAHKMIANPYVQVQLVVENDDICKGCRHLKGTQCDDVLSQLTPSPSKQSYNDVLDSILLDFLGLKTNTILTVKEYAHFVDKKMPDLIDYCTHPKEDRKMRMHGMKKGLTKLIDQ